jgi:hypothetical protein
MPRSTAVTIAAFAGLASLGVGAASGCVDRAIHEGICGDGRLSRGEVCLGEGDRSTLTIDSLAPLALRVADFHGDGPPDLMVLGTDPAGAVIARLWRGDGEGGFFPPLDPGVFGCSAHPVPGSIDGDAITDLLVADCAPSMSAFRGTATGTFEAPVSVYTGVTTLGSGLLDLDADGLHEVVVLGLTPDGLVAISVVERDPTGGGFGLPVTTLMVASDPGFVPSSFSVLDADGDPHPDLLVVHSGNPAGLGIAHGQPGFRFDPPVILPPIAVVPDGATARDLDGDGRDEVLVVSFDDAVYVVLDVEATAAGVTLVERARTEIPGLEPSAAALADLDGDGRDDLIRVEPGAAKLEARLGHSSGRFDDPTEIDIDTPADQIAVADLDQDGALDVVVGSFEAAQLRVLLTSP